MASDIFQNTTGGVWSLATNWSAGLPDSNSQVSFADGTYTSTVDSTGTAWTIQSLNVNSAGADARRQYRHHRCRGRRDPDIGVDEQQFRHDHSERQRHADRPEPQQ